MLELLPGEQYWSSRQAWLQLRGYRLRARYQPDWTPSWVTNPDKNPSLQEDHIYYMPLIMDAVRIHDNVPVVLKAVALPGIWQDKHELAIIQYLSNPDISQDPQNISVPIYEVLYNVPDDPEQAIIVMPLLRKFDSPRFDTVGECLGFLQDIFKGLQFLHHHRIAHRDCTGLNVMMQASDLYPGGFHPKEQDRNLDYTGPAVQKFTRTQRPPKYYWIDFGLSVQFEPSDQFPRARVIPGNDSSPPEFDDPIFMSQPQDPFPTDIYYLGNLVRSHFTEGSPRFKLPKRYGFDFMKPLVAAMCQEDPSKRPTIDQCVTHLDEIIRSRSSWTLRSQVWHSTDNPVGFLYRFVPHWIRRITYIMAQTPAIPKAA